VGDVEALLEVGFGSEEGAAPPPSRRKSSVAMLEDKTDFPGPRKPKLLDRARDTLRSKY